MFVSLDICMITFHQSENLSEALDIVAQCYGLILHSRLKKRLRFINLNVALRTCLSHEPCRLEYSKYTVCNLVVYNLYSFFLLVYPFLTIWISFYINM